MGTCWQLSVVHWNHILSLAFDDAITGFLFRWGPCVEMVWFLFSYCFVIVLECSESTSLWDFLFWFRTPSRSQAPKSILECRFSLRERRHSPKGHKYNNHVSAPLRAKAPVVPIYYNCNLATRLLLKVSTRINTNDNSLTSTNLGTGWFRLTNASRQQLGARLAPSTSRGKADVAIKTTRRS